VADVVKALAGTFNQVRKGEVDPKTGNCLGLLAGQLLRALQEGELAGEIEALRRDLEQVKHERGSVAADGQEVASGVGDLHGQGDADPGAPSPRADSDHDDGGTDAGSVAERVVGGEELVRPLFA
jgi:hypothetical protein